MENEHPEYAAQKGRGRNKKKTRGNDKRNKSNNSRNAPPPHEWVGKVPQNVASEDTTAALNYFPNHVGTDDMESIDFYCILDFEATCDNIGRIPKRQSEVIEFPSVLVDVSRGAKKATVVSEFQRYCKPRLHPTLYPFCTELTGITQEMVDEGIPFRQALIEHSRWLASHLNEGGDPDGQPIYSVAIVTCGSWDLETCFPSQLDLLEMSPNGIPSVYNRWINIKNTFASVAGKKGGGMTGMLNEFGLPLTGRHHSGIDDSRNICNLFLCLMNAGALPEQYVSVRY